MQGEAHIAEPRSGNPDPFPAVTGLGSDCYVGQSGVQLGQFQAPFSSGVEVPAGDGFVQESFGFAVVIWTVHSVLLVFVGFVPGYQAYVDLTRVGRLRFSVRVGGRCHKPGSPGSGLGRILYGQRLTRVWARVLAGWAYECGDRVGDVRGARLLLAGRCIRVHAHLDRTDGVDHGWAARADALYAQLVPPDLDPDPLATVERLAARMSAK